MTQSAIRALNIELKGLREEPLEGFRVKLVSDDNLFDWEVAIFGPPGTIYQGGYFKARMHFPKDYPFNPPTLRFDRSTPLFHPNVYESGDLCISILHPPVNDPQSGELPSERWNPTQNVRTILLSVVSLLNEPNTFSPANVDASVMYRRWKESEGKDNAYETRVKEQVVASKLEAAKDGVVVPTTLEDYVIKPPNASATKSSLDTDSFYEDDDDDYLDDNNDDQNSTATDDSFGGSGSTEQQEQGNSADSADYSLPSTETESGSCGNSSSSNSDSDSHVNSSPRDKKAGGESFEEYLCDEKDGPTSKKKIKLAYSDSSPNSSSQ